MQPKIYKRAITDKIKLWLNRPEIIVLTGARQTGKTFFMRHILPTLTTKPIRYFNFEDFTLRETFQNNPKGFVEAINNQSHLYVFDEFQKVPNFTGLLKARYDAGKELLPKIFLTGSASLAIQKEVSESLVGQSIAFTLYSLSWCEQYAVPTIPLLDLLPGLNSAELGRQLLLSSGEYQRHLEEYLYAGGFPELGELTAEQRPDKLRSIVQTILERDLQSLINADHLFSSKKILEIAAHRVGSRFSFEAVASDVQLNSRTVRTITALLEGLYFFTFLYPLSTKGNEYKKMPKSYFYDLGIRNTLLQWSSLPPDPTALGPVVENFVFGQLCRFQAYRQPLALSYWQDYNDNEVDFIITKDTTRISVEVKYRRTPNHRLTRGIMNFIDRYHPQYHITFTVDYWGQSDYHGCRIFWLPAYVAGLLV